MGRRQLKSEDVDGFMLAFWDEVVDTERMYQVQVDMRVVRSSDRGKWAFLAEAFYTGPDAGALAVARTERYYPSPRYTSIHGCLYALAMSLNVEVQRWYRDRTGDWYSSPVDEPANS